MLCFEDSSVIGCEPWMLAIVEVLDDRGDDV